VQTCTVVVVVYNINLFFFSFFSRRFSCQNPHLPQLSQQRRRRRIKGRREPPESPSTTTTTIAAIQHHHKPFHDNPPEEEEEERITHQPTPPPENLSQHHQTTKTTPKNPFQTQHKINLSQNQIEIKPNGNPYEKTQGQTSDLPLLPPNLPLLPPCVCVRLGLG